MDTSSRTASAAAAMERLGRVEAFTSKRISSIARELDRQAESLLTVVPTVEKGLARCEELADEIEQMWSKIVRNVTVEPLFFILWFTGGIAWGSGAFNELELWKACVVGMKYNDTVCGNLTKDEFDEQENDVQRFLNNFEIYYGYAASIPGIFLAIFAGALSDRFGRKPLLIMPMVGWSLWLLFFSVHYAFIRKLPMEIVYLDILTYFFGGGMFFYMAVYSIATDVTAPEERAQRLAIFDAVDYSAWFLGTLLSTPVFRAFNYEGIIVVRGLGLAFSLTYAILYVKETRPPREKKQREKVNCSKRTAQILHDYLWIPLRDFSICVSTPRRGYRRLYLYLELALYLVYIFCGMYGAQTYLYMNKAFPKEFSLELYNYYKLWVRLVTVFNLVVIMPILLRKFKLNEITIALINCLLCSLGLLLSAFARNIFPEYMLAISLTCMDYSQWSLIRTTVTKTVTKSEVGKVFSVMGLIAACTPMVTATLVKKVYNATLEIFPSAYLVMAACFYLLAAALNYTLFLVRKEIDDVEEKDGEKKETDDENVDDNNEIQK